MQSTTERVDIRELLEAGVHFGHQAKRWNPKMKRYIFAERAGVHIIDLDQTLTLLEKSLSFVRGVAEANREVLFVGTKKQAQIPLAEQALRSGQPYVAERYIGGMLTNFQTILPRIQYFKELAARVEETPEEERTGRSWFALAREYQKLRRNFSGITEMERLPGAVFVVDPKREELLVKEANRLKIPVVALTDTNCDPEVVDYVIPGNDDAIRSISLISRLIADAVIEGRGEEAVPSAERPVPPVVEQTEFVEEPELSEAAGNGAGETNGQAEAPTAPAEPASAEATDAGGATEAEDAPEAEETAAEAVEEPAVENAVGDAADATGAADEAASDEEPEATETPAAESEEPEATEQPQASPPEQSDEEASEEAEPENTEDEEK
jgi:small subunit ribosomal protein S2